MDEKNDYIEEEKIEEVVNEEKDGNDILKISWIRNNENVVSYGVDEFNFVEELENVPFDENDSYVPEWNNDLLYHVIKKNVDKMYYGALQEHLRDKDKNSSIDVELIHSSIAIATFA